MPRMANGRDVPLPSCALTWARSAGALGRRCSGLVSPRVQQATCGYRGRKGDLLYAARRTLHTESILLTDKQRQRLTALFADDEHVEVEATWGIYQHMIAAYREPDRKRGRELLQQLIGSISHRSLLETGGFRPLELRCHSTCCCGPATWIAAPASTATYWAWPSAGSSALRTILGWCSPSRACPGSSGTPRPCRALDDVDPAIREGRGPLLKRLGWLPNRSGIEKRPGAAAPSVASDGRHHAEP